MKNLSENYTITTIYFDGQFWCALIERYSDENKFIGRYIFAEEPKNPRILNWMLFEFDKIKLFKVEDSKSKIRFKKLAKRNDSHSIPKSFVQFAKAQKKFLEERKNQNRKLKKIAQKEKYEAKKQKKKEFK